MAFEDLLKNQKTEIKSNATLTNLASSLAVSQQNKFIKKEAQLHSIMINQGEYDYLALQVRAGKQELISSLLQKKFQIIEQEILYKNSLGIASIDDPSTINRKTDELTNYRWELEAIKQDLGHPSQYRQTILQSLEPGIDLEGTLADSVEKYLELIADKLKFGGIIDQNRVGRLCGFGSQAAKNGDLLVAIKSYSIAGMILQVKEDFKKILKKAKKAKNPQYKAAEELINNLTPKLKK